MNESSAYYSPEIISQIAPLGMGTSRLMEGPISGQHRSPLHGVSPEFAEHRNYAPGDDLRNLDWRVWGRSDRFFVKRYEEESNLRAHLLLDASASMAYSGRKPAPEAAQEKFRYAATAAVSLAAVLLRQRDAVGLTTFDVDGEKRLPMSAAASQLHKILRALDPVRPEGSTDLGGVLSRLADQLRRRSLVVVVSDLLTPLEAVYDAMGRVQYGGHELLVLQVLHRDEMELPFNGSVIFRDIEGQDELFAEPWAFRRAYRQAMRAFVDEVASRCRFCGIDHLLVYTDEPMGTILHRFLSDRAHRGPLKRRGKMTAR